MDLTRKEMEVLNCLCDGQSDEEIARTLYISVSTVKSHVHHLLEKFNLRDRTQLVVYAFKNKKINLKMDET